MSYQLKRKENYTTTNWAGGTTSEIFLYPPTGDFPSRNFQVRMSTATVTQEHSVFSDLSGFHRFLTLLEGQIELTHKGRYTRTLTPYLVEPFDGSWETSSVGQCVDFNLMHSPQWEGSLDLISTPQQFTSSPSRIVTFFSLLDGLTIRVEEPGQADEHLILNRGDSVTLDTLPEDSPRLTLALSGPIQTTDPTPPLALMATVYPTPNAKESL